MFDTFLHDSVGVVATLLLVILGLLIVTAIILYFVDSRQTSDAVRHNYPVIGRFRYIFEHLGEFFRQYFFAMDREELPFNRAIRRWIYRASTNESLSNAFGSTHDMNKNGSVVFLNSAYPRLDNEKGAPDPIIIGANCPQPYTAKSYFNISAMSYGSLSKVAVEALSKGAAKAGCWLNTGEGSVSPYHLSGHCDIVFQIGTAKYGCRDKDGQFCEKSFQDVTRKEQVKLIELKLSQGAKPGKGGILPGGKVTPEIAKIRGIPQGEDSISPNRHPDINNDEQLLNFIEKLKKLCGKPVGIKFVLGQTGWIDELCEAIKKRPHESRPDFITLDSGDGGTGAAPQPLMDLVGLPIKDSLPIVAKALVDHGLRSDIRLIASGKMVAPGAVAQALASGADLVNSARGFMFSLGCIQALKCNKNTCPTGITTHNEELQEGLNPSEKSERVASYHKNMVKSVEMIAHSCGLSNSRQLTMKHMQIITDRKTFAKEVNKIV